ncbi:MAG: hypothetical protein KDG53_19485, partial [Rhodocyclaceae bacterium]|nr:hypothetical protein [Rhodocyclaceae bacterium]
FTLLNLCGAAVWACVIGLAGYTFGAVIETFLGDLRHLEEWILLALLVIVPLALHFVHRHRRRKRSAEK